MDVLKAREALDRGRKALGEGLGGIFDFAGVEGADTADLEASTNLRGKTPLTAANVSPAHTERYHEEGETYVLERTMSRNSWLVGTTGMSFHCVFMLADCVFGW